jgi:hypothetical protein
MRCDYIMTAEILEVGNTVKVKEGVVCPDMENLDISGWQGRISEITKDKDGNLLIYIEWDSITLENIPDIFIEDSEENGLGFDCMSLFDNEVELTICRDTKEDRDETIKKIRDEHMIFW